MTTALRRPAAPATTGALLARLLDEPALAAQVAALEPRVLARTIHQSVGCDRRAAGASGRTSGAHSSRVATRSSLRSGGAPGSASHRSVSLDVLMNCSGWRAAPPGRARGRRRADRAGDDRAAGRGVRRALAADLSADKALASSLSEELDGYQLVSRRPDGWDTVLAAVLALDRDHRALLVRILDRLVALGRDELDDRGGLYAVLTSEEMLAGDAAAEREDRRAAIGHVAPRDAASFLALARGDGDAHVRDPVTRAYFRALARTPATAAPDGAALRALLADAELDDDQVDRRRTLASTTGEPAVLAALRALAAGDPARVAERQSELAYLANVLVAGATVGRGRERRPVRPVEAARAAVAIVDRGLAVAAEQDGAAPQAIVAARSADELFRLGWARLHRDAAGRGASFAANDLDLLDP